MNNKQGQSSIGIFENDYGIAFLSKKNLTTFLSSLSLSHINTARAAKWPRLTFTKIYVHWSKEAECETETSTQRVF